MEDHIILVVNMFREPFEEPDYNYFILNVIHKSCESLTKKI